MCLFSDETRARTLFYRMRWKWMYVKIAKNKSRNVITAKIVNLYNTMVGVNENYLNGDD